MFLVFSTRLDFTCMLEHIFTHAKTVQQLVLTKAFMKFENYKNDLKTIMTKLFLH